MYGWSFAARTIEEVARLFRAMGRHRYLASLDLRLHWSVDAALAGLDDRFGQAAVRHRALAAERPDLELGSRDPVLWRPAELEEVLAALAAFWDRGERGVTARAALAMALRVAEIESCAHDPFAGDPDEPPHPELVLMDWELLPVEKLDPERHAGALRALANAGEDVDPSEPVWIEGPTLAEPELCGVEHGVLPADPLLWADGPYRYSEYVLRGVARAAKLVDPPVGYRDL